MSISIICVFGGCEDSTRSRTLVVFIYEIIEILKWNELTYEIMSIRFYDENHDEEEKKIEQCR